MALVPFNLSLWKVGYDGNVAGRFFVSYLSYLSHLSFWSIAYMFLGWNHLFGRIFVAFHFFSVCTQGAQWIGAIPGSCQGAEHHEIRQVETWLGRWEEIRDFECPVSLGRHKLGPATSGCSLFETKQHHGPRLLRWLTRGETCHQPEEVQGVPLYHFCWIVGWLDA